MLTDIATFDETIKMCSRTGGKVFIPTTTEQNNKIHSVLTQPSSVCSPNYQILLGVRRNIISEHWSSYDGRRNVDVVFFRENADSVTFANNDCASMGISSPLWYLDNCSSNQPLSCTPCSYGNFPPLRLKGLCFKQEEFGFTYILGYHSKTPYFYSLSGILIYKENNNEWYMFDATKQKIVASIRLVADTYNPLGRKLWIVQVHGLCQFRQHDNVLITLTSCESSMFTCDSGDCIASNDLCDGIAQCQDQSDESNCAILHVPQTYNSRSPPQNEAPLIIISNIEILQVLEIDDDHHWLQLDLVVTLTWKDGRLKFMNLHKDSDDNFLSDDEVAQIWIPKFQFSPVQDGDSTLIDKQVQIVAAGEALSTDYNRHRKE
ncbi:uncharacterized protein LOC125178641 [Hyalella azteca]|uniref:Uncharacterized protein LOC125178641 n=1 Tax=Hyalella azteca TaxID=294128 RepID=A0A979FP35_HYAAZ|nr:uncharacterized protein LOC125178641 [Hyalella azteca]